MDIVIWIFTVFATFIVTEFTAWFNHKYLMHGPLWILHKDHHKKDHSSWFERNDLFFFFYAFLSFIFVVLWGQGFWLGLPIAIGIGLYGLAYFIVHDIFIHQRFKIFRNIDNKYASPYKPIPIAIGKPNQNPLPQRTTNKTLKNA